MWSVIRIKDGGKRQNKEIGTFLTGKQKKKEM
jgi:hypothetical protein